MKKITSFFLFIIIVFGELTGKYLQLQWMEYIFKPLIMIFIGGYFYLHSRSVEKNIAQLTMLAFGFSWLGDILLIFGDSDFIFFIFGLVAFLGAQIVYIILFFRTIKLTGKTSFLKKKPYWLLAYIVYGMTIYIVLFNHLDAVLKVAVFLYMLALLGMSSMALNRFRAVNSISFSMVFTGSVLFVLSDSMIAINRFWMAIPLEGVWVMITYIAAQYLIMRGILKQYE